MQTTKKAKSEQLFEATSKQVTVTIKEISESGITMDLNNTIETKGKINARGLSTTTVVSKPDGTGVFENRGILTTRDGDFIATWAKGTGRNTSGGGQEWEGEVHFMTQSPKLAWLNKAKVWTEGSGSQATGEGHATFYQRE